ncbi:MAG TPA: DinB family protein [Pseudonocardiaceae bacterium]
MPEDVKPPRLASDERATLRALLRYQRDSMVRKVTGVDDTAARRAFVGSGTSLLWLVKHMTRAETVWILRRFAGQQVPIPDDTVHPHDSLVTAMAAYRDTWTRVDAVIEAVPSLDEACRDVGDAAPVNLRWVLMHLLEETARHAGHADIMRELIDGQTGR